ncbi:MAG: helix-turn-helix domain-containing protein [Candidatus Methanomethylicaceae archaeon]
MKRGIPNRIREFRKKKGLREVDLAKKVGIHQSEISDIEIGKRKPNIYLAKRIAEALEKDVNEVFPNSIARRKRKSIYEKYRGVLRDSKLSNDERDKMRYHMKLLALAIVEHFLKAKINQIY